MPQLQAIDIPAPYGILEGLLRLPDPGAAAAMAAVVCHPHPRFGGTMHNKVIFRVAQALGELGMPVLRFNFRGVGRSTGTYDEGRGERDDVRAALDALAGRYPNLPLCLAGFSFGAWVGLPVGCADARVAQLIGVGVPVSLLSTDALAECDKPKLIVQGERDEYGPGGGAALVVRAAARAEATQDRAWRGPLLYRVSAAAPGCGAGVFRLGRFGAGRVAWYRPRTKGGRSLDDALQSVAGKSGGADLGMLAMMG